VKVVAEFSFNNGRRVICRKWARELKEIWAVITSVNAKKFRTKISREKTMPGRQLNDPRALNREFKAAFARLGWRSQRVRCEYSSNYYHRDYQADRPSREAFREMDYVKNRLGVEVQFGKYAFMVYNVCAKMTIFHNLGFIDAGVEIVPVKAFADQMSTGVSYFEQFVWDLEKRGVSDIDIPVLVVGVDA
jgi:hypothetical protein